MLKVQLQAVGNMGSAKMEAKWGGGSREQLELLFTESPKVNRLTHNSVKWCDASWANRVWPEKTWKVKWSYWNPFKLKPWYVNWGSVPLNCISCAAKKYFQRSGQPRPPLAWALYISKWPIWGFLFCQINFNNSSWIASIVEWGTYRGKELK